MLYVIIIRYNVGAAGKLRASLRNFIINLQHRCKLYTKSVCIIHFIITRILALTYSKYIVYMYNIYYSPVGISLITYTSLTYIRICNATRYRLLIYIYIHNFVKVCFRFVYYRNN